ncbi:MAG: tetratricopeptide repeat protein [bacterium]
MRLLLRPTALTLSLFLAGYVYYNTFYNAKSNYADAVKGQDVEPGRANKELLEKCITRCEKVVKYHPRSRWADDAVLLMGKCFYYMGEHRNALRKFEELEIYYPEGGLLPESYYYSGLAHQALGSRNSAIASFRQAVESEPEGELVEQSIYQIVNTYFLDEDYDDAISSSTDFLSRFPRSEYKDEVLFIQAQSFFNVERYDESIAAFEEFLSTGPKKKLRFEALLKTGEAHLESQRIEEALDVFLSLRKETLTPLEDAELAIRIAQGSRSLGNTEKALKQLDEVTILYSKTAASAEAYYLMGVICEQDLRELEKAREYYDKARSEAPYSEFSNQALMRATSIAKLAEYREKVKSGEQTDLAEAQFLLAELYYLEFNRIDEALDEYRKVVDDYPDSKYGPRAAFAVAWILDHVKKDHAGARAAYRDVVERYPNTEYSNAADEAVKRIEEERLNQ